MGPATAGLGSVTVPFDTTRVIDPDWSQHHAPVAAGGMNATVQIFNPADDVPGWDPVTESQGLVHGAPVYDGPARVQELNRPDQATQADQEVTSHQYLVQILMGAAHIEKGWPLVVTVCANDADVVAWTAAREATINDVQHGSERFTRDLGVSINLD